MPNIDLNYLSTVIGNLAGVPIRVFRGEEQTFYHSVVTLPKGLPLLRHRQER